MRIRYFGHMGERTGYGVAAEHYCKALESAGVTVERVPFTNAAPIESNGNPLDVSSGEIDAVIIHTLPVDCVTVKDQLLTLPNGWTTSGTYPRVALIALTSWEACTIEHDISLELQMWFDEVWTHSEASADPLRRQHEPGEDHNVHVVPCTFPLERISPPITTHRKPGAPFRFYWIGAWTARKNPSGLIRAFVHAFRPNYPGYEGDVELYLHSHGTPVEALAAELASTGIPRDQMPRVVLNNEYLDDATMSLLHQSGDCFVSAARGEAWNLPAFEALCHRRHIITTENLGSDDFLVDTSATRVNARKVPAWNTLVRALTAHGGMAGAELVGTQGLTSRDTWLEPDLCRFAAAMRRTYEIASNTPELKYPLLVHYDIAERYGYPAVAKTMLTRLENLRP